MSIFSSPFSENKSKINTVNLINFDDKKGLFSLSLLTLNPKLLFLNRLLRILIRKTRTLTEPEFSGLWCKTRTPSPILRKKVESHAVYMCLIEFKKLILNELSNFVK